MFIKWLLTFSSSSSYNSYHSSAVVELSPPKYGQFNKVTKKCVMYVLKCILITIFFYVDQLPTLIFMVTRVIGYGHSLRHVIKS